MFDDYDGDDGDDDDDDDDDGDDGDDDDGDDEAAYDALFLEIVEVVKDMRPVFVGRSPAAVIAGLCVAAAIWATREGLSEEKTTRLLATFFRNMDSEDRPVIDEPELP